ncbi:MAG: RNA polymerase factor sigma-32 [Sandaracinaceae bacterium]|nr:RNA polymerase factor sigma-32 [Sandaracinaceae bacterium]
MPPLREGLRPDPRERTFSLPFMATRRAAPRPEDDALDGELVDDRDEHHDDADAEPEGPPARTQGGDDEALEGEVIEGELVGDEGEPAEAELEGDVDFSLDDDKKLAGRISKSTALARQDAVSIATQDPLQAYMRDVQRYSLLTPEETHELATRYTQTGDVEAAKKLVTSNLRLVVKIAFDYRRAYRNILDLVQEGNIGLMQAVKKYDPNRGVKLSSYAAWWIRAYILRFILNNWRLVKLGTTQAQRKLFFNLKKEKAKLAALGIDPTPELIAEKLDVPAEEVVSMDRRLSGAEVSLDAPLSQGSDGRPTTRIEMMASEQGPIDEALAQGELNEILTEKIHEFGRTLTGKDAIIFTERLVAEEPKTLQELGDQFGVSRERVRQLEKRLQDKIRVYLESQVEKSALR